MKKAPAFTKESDLCAAFIAAIKDDPHTRRGEWTAYAETEGWDILLVRKSDGVQIGVEAKLRLNNKVVAQALPGMSQWRNEVGPDYRAVLVPRRGCENDLEPICAALGITVISFYGEDDRQFRYRMFSPGLPDDHSPEYQWHQWAPMRRHDLPDYVPDVDARCSAPVALTKWKISAIKLAILLEQRAVTRADFKALSLSPTRWTDPYTGWLAKGDGGYVAGPRLPDFRAQHPVNFEQIKADFPKWGANLKLHRPVQLALAKSGNEGTAP